ncbi:MAG TPA: ribbon-helix-helix domain-containing protein [Thermoanaerobaculia bacterium]|nr:ribbon-helix-helix domain-containing protein [Thermoanaerobaculia bacterium]
MARAKIAITLDEAALADVDQLVEDGVFPNRSKAIEAAVFEKLQRQRKSRLADECAKLDPVEEQALAEEGMRGDVEWPDY